MVVGKVGQDAAVGRHNEVHHHQPSWNVPQSLSITNCCRFMRHRSTSPPEVEGGAGQRRCPRLSAGGPRYAGRVGFNFPGKFRLPHITRQEASVHRGTRAASHGACARPYEIRRGSAHCGEDKVHAGRIRKCTSSGKSTSISRRNSVHITCQTALWMTPARCRFAGRLWPRRQAAQPVEGQRTQMADVVMERPADPTTASPPISPWITCRQGGYSGRGSDPFAGFFGRIFR